MVVDVSSASDATVDCGDSGIAYTSLCTEVLRFEVRFDAVEARDVAFVLRGMVISHSSPVIDEDLVGVRQCIVQIRRLIAVSPRAYLCGSGNG